MLTSNMHGGALPTPITVAICDDSAVIRGAIGRIVSAAADLRLVQRAANGRELLEGLSGARPDVIVLDVEMPELDGLSALPRVLAAQPGVRVLMSSTLTTRGADTTLRALRLGAADYIPKPSSLAGWGSGGDWATDLLGKIRALGAARRRPRSIITPGGEPAITLRLAPVRHPEILAIGCSTGGPAALIQLLPVLGRNFALPILVTQHMPPTFTSMLAEHIGRLSGPGCSEATDGMVVEPGHIYLARGDRHMVVERAGAGLVLRLTDDPPEHFCRPAVDPLLRSLARHAGDRTLAVILTGMGSDGKLGAEAVVAAGGGVMAQDEATSVVWGMPGAVARAGLCHAVLPLGALAERLRDIGAASPFARRFA